MRSFVSPARLRNRNVMLSASIPHPKRADTYRRVPDAHLHIEQAVIALARAVFANAGRLVFGGHPTIVPLVATIASEYAGSRRLETDEPVDAPVLVFQSEAYAGSNTDLQDLMVKYRLAKEISVPSVNGERFDPRKESHVQCAASLERMRFQMIQEGNPIALVCVGGMEGVEREFELFRKLKPGAPIWLLETTGGAASLLARGEPLPNVRIIGESDLQEWRATLSKFRVADTLFTRTPNERGDEIAPPSPTPYTYIMQRIVRDLVDHVG